MEQSHLDHALSEDQSLIAATVQEFARDRVAPNHEALDHAGVHPEELFREMAELGLFGTFIPEERGGAGAGFLAHVVTVETLAAAGGLAGVLPTAQGIVIDALIQAGGTEASEPHLLRLATGEGLGAPALCNVIGPADAGISDCGLDDLVVIRRRLAALAPAIQPVCAPAVP